MGNKSLIKKSISKAREILIKDYASIFERLGFNEKGLLIEEKTLTKAEIVIRNNIVNLFNNIGINGDKDKFSKYIQNTARTFLHILIAFKTMEMRNLISNLINNILNDKNYYNQVLPNFRDSDPLAYRNLCEKYKEEIDIVEKKYQSREARDYYEFIYVLRILSKEMALEVPLLFMDLENSLFNPGFKTIKEVLFIFNELSNEEYKEDDFLGWVYQYWVDVDEDELKNAKKEAKIGFKENLYNIILSQLEDEQTKFGEFYTPRWVVKYIVDNTLKPYWMDNKNIEEIKLLDPACGAGNFLVYSFNVFYELYKNEYPEMKDETIIHNILKNNIFGVDIQREPLQVAALNLWLKVKKKASDVRIEDMKLFNMNILKANSLYHYENESQKVQLPLFDDINNLIEIQYSSEDIGKYITQQKNRNILRAKELFDNSFDIIVMNPPFVDARKMDSKTSEFLKDKYPDNSRNLFSAFIQRAIELNKKRGKIGFISSDTFMYLGSFENIRNYILNDTNIKEIVDLGIGVFDGPTVRCVINILTKVGKNDNIIKVYDLKHFHKNKQLKIDIINKWINATEKKYELPQKKFSEILNKPFIYDISDDIRNIFATKEYIGTGNNPKCSIKQGMATGNNNKYLKYKWEIKNELIGTEYIPYAKGGGYSKFANDILTYVLWKDNGKDIKSYAKSVIRNEEFFLKEAITYSDITSNNKFSARYLPEGHIFDVKGSCIFSDEIDYNYLLGFINSKLVNYFLLKLNPTPSFQVGDMIRIPYIEPDKKTEDKVINLTKIARQKKEWLLGFNYISDFYHQVEIEYGFENNSSIIEAYKFYLNKYENTLLNIYKIKLEIDKLIYNLYKISKVDIEIIEERFNKSAYRFPSISNKSEILTQKEFEQLYYIGDPKLDGRQQQPMNITDIAEYKEMNPDDVLELRKEYGLYRDKDLKEAVLNWLRAIVKDEIISQDPKLYLDEDIEKIIRIYIENRFEQGYQITEEVEEILEKPLIEIIRVGAKLGSSNTPLAGGGTNDIREPLLQQKILSGRGKNKIVVLWHLQQFLLEFDEERKYVMQNEIRRIIELLQQKLNNCKEKLQREGLLKKEIKDLQKEEKLLKDSIIKLDKWQVV